MMQTSALTQSTLSLSECLRALAAQVDAAWHDHARRLCMCMLVCMCVFMCVCVCMCMCMCMCMCAC